MSRDGSHYLLWALGARGNGADAGGRPETGGNSGASSDNIQGTCLSAADISNAIGVEMRAPPEGTQTGGATVVCEYMSHDNQFAVYTAVGPASLTKTALEQLRQSVKAELGLARNRTR